MMESSVGIVDMDWYYDKLVNTNDEIKMERKIKRELVFIGLLLISSMVTLMVMFTSFWRQATKVDIYVVIAFGFNLITIVLYFANDSIDPLKVLNKSDCIFIWMEYFLKKFKNHEVKKVWFHLILRIINSQIYSVELKMNELFIFHNNLERYIDKIETLTKILSTKRDYLLTNKEKLCELFQVIILLYGFKIKDNLIINNYKRVYTDELNREESELWERYEQLANEILSSRNQEERKIFDSMEKVRLVIVIVVVIITALFIYYMLKHQDLLSKVSSVVTIVGVPSSILALLIKKSNFFKRK